MGTPNVVIINPVENGYIIDLHYGDNGYKQLVATNMWDVYKELVNIYEPKEGNENE